MLVNVNCQITMPRHVGAKRPPPPERGKTLCPQTIIWAHKIIFALLLVYVTGYRMLGGTFYIKYISLSASVG